MVKDRHAAERSMVIADASRDADSAVANGTDAAGPIPGFAFNPLRTPDDVSTPPAHEAGADQPGDHPACCPEAENG